MRSIRRVVALLVLAGPLGCLGPRVAVLPSGSATQAALQPKPASCELPFFRTTPDKPYDEIAAVQASGGDTFKDGPDDFTAAIRAKGCELGADAVIVTQEYSGRGGNMTGVAIKYRSNVVTSAASH